LKKNDVAYKTNAVRELMNDFKITQAVVDLYHGHDMVDILKVQEGLGDKFVGCINHGSVSKAYNFNKSTGVITVNKDMVLEELFMKLKTGKIKLPGKGNSDEKFHWLIEHICSMQTEV